MSNPAASVDAPTRVSLRWWRLEGSVYWMSVFQHLFRVHSLFAEWIAKRFPWYVRLVAGQSADEVFRQITRNAKRFQDN